VGKNIEVLTRAQVEQGDEILRLAKENENQVALLVPGDALTATTHIELLLRARKEKITTSVIHGQSIVTAVPGLLGLQVYKFGRTTTLAYPEGDYFPKSPYDVVKNNIQQGLHTLILLDIHAEEKRYMTANEGIEILLEINSNRSDEVFNVNKLACVVARAGSENPTIAANKAEKLLQMDFGPPLHSIVIPGKLHFKESEALIVLADAPKEILNLD
jgi:diphthine synthase